MPSCSPVLGDLVVSANIKEGKEVIRETENPNCVGCSANRRLRSDDLPQPEGPVITISESINGFSTEVVRRWNNQMIPVILFTENEKRRFNIKNSYILFLFERLRQHGQSLNSRSNSRRKVPSVALISLSKCGFTLCSLYLQDKERAIEVTIYVIVYLL